MSLISKRRFWRCVSRNPNPIEESFAPESSCGIKDMKRCWSARPLSSLVDDRILLPDRQANDDSSSHKPEDLGDAATLVRSLGFSGHERDPLEARPPASRRTTPTG